MKRFIPTVEGMEKIFLMSGLPDPTSPVDVPTNPNATIPIVDPTDPVDVPVPDFVNYHPLVATADDPLPGPENPEPVGAPTPVEPTLPPGGGAGPGPFVSN